MKILFAALLVSTLSFGQMKVTKIKEAEKIGKVGGLGTIFMELNKNEDSYTLTYKDEKYAHLNNYKSFSFKDSESLYNILLDGIKEKKKQTIKLDLEDDVLILEFKKSFGKGVVEIYHHPYKDPNIIGKVQWMDEKRLNKLFGKKK